jgi:hypothetical protein
MPGESSSIPATNVSGGHAFASYAVCFELCSRLYRLATDRHNRQPPSGRLLTALLVALDFCQRHTEAATDLNEA